MNKKMRKEVKRLAKLHDMSYEEMARQVLIISQRNPFKNISLTHTINNFMKVDFFNQVVRFFLSDVADKNSETLDNEFLEECIFNNKIKKGLIYLMDTPEYHDKAMKLWNGRPEAWKK